MVDRIVLYSWKPDYGCCRGSLLITAQHLGGQIKRMSAGKTISLYLESQERSLPPSLCLPAPVKNSLNPLSVSALLLLLLPTILLYGGGRMEADSLPGINYARP